MIDLTRKELIIDGPNEGQLISFAGDQFQSVSIGDGRLTAGEGASASACIYYPYRILFGWQAGTATYRRVWSQNPAAPALTWSEAELERRISMAMVIHTIEGEMSLTPKRF